MPATPANLQRASKTKISLSLPAMTVEHLTTMAKDRGMSIDALVGELVELGLIYLTHESLSA